VSRKKTVHGNCSAVPVEGWADTADDSDVLEGAAVAASLVFPPAVLAVPVIETIQLGENYDLIIGVDGNRVTNFMDFQDQLRDAQPGETVYLNILRSGKRLQVPVEMPPPSAAKLEP
jgi:S1-C subfamily serine protease